MNSDSILGLLGIARRGGNLEAGEEPVGSAARDGHARLIITASDCADNTTRRAERFASLHHSPCIKTSYSKEQLGASIGKESCAILCVTDFGLAAAIVNKLAVKDPSFKPEAEQLKADAARAAERKLEKRIHDRKKGKKHTNH